MINFEERGHGNVTRGTVAQATDAVYEDGRVVLFATKTCPKCKIAASLLEKAGIEFEKVYFEDDPDFAKKYNTRQAPTLLYIVGEDFTAFADIAGVKEFIKTTAQA